MKVGKLVFGPVEDDNRIGGEVPRRAFLIGWKASPAASVEHVGRAATDGNAYVLDDRSTEALRNEGLGLFQTA